MDAATMKAIVVSLLAWIGAHSNYAVPNETPAVAMVSHDYLVALACDGDCPVMGVYPDRNVVYIDANLQVETNVCARSVLLHELVHYLQNRDGRFLNLPSPIRSYAREHEAYSIQQQYLAANGRQVAFGPNLPIGAFMGPTC